MKILFVASEITPLIKVGGLADVVGALPLALRKLGHDVRVMIPGYAQIDLQQVSAQPLGSPVEVPWQGALSTVGVWQGQVPGTTLPLYLIDSPIIKQYPTVYFQTHKPDDARNELERFVFFNWAAAHLLPQIGWSPDVIHCHDWHAGFLPTLLKLPRFEYTAGTMVTIHNLNIQGRWSADEVFDWLGLQADEHPALKLRDGLDNLNVFQQGIRQADIVTTVSPTYAQEILTPEFGEGLELDLAQRPGGVTGILNGIDADRFNPATDPDLAQTYTADSAAEVKAKLKSGFQQELGLPSDPAALLIGSVGRINEQKGYQLLLDILPQLFATSTQLVILGSGTPELEHQLNLAFAKHPDQARLIVKFDPHLAQRIYASSDAFLMPSKFEPCGLGQMIAMRYGTLPIVRDTGGLHDTVVDLGQHPASGTGFVFQQFSSRALLDTIERVHQAFADASTWQAACQRAMLQDFSWDRSAQAYLTLYAKIQKHTAKN